MPDYILACVGGGSNAAGIFFHYLGHQAVQLVAIEAARKGLDTNEDSCHLIKKRKTRHYLTEAKPT